MDERPRVAKAIIPIAAPSSSNGGAPEHPRISDELARAVLQSLLESDGVGIALLRATDWSHILTSATYERHVGKAGTLGRVVGDVLPRSVAPHSMLELVVASGFAASAPQPLVRLEGTGASSAPVHVAVSYLRVRHVTPGLHGVLVMTRDISAEIHQQRIAKLFLALANEPNDPRDGRSSIRSTVEQGRTALGADAASVFLTSADGLRLHGAIVGWDWTRTSFDAEIELWPNVRDAIRANAASYLTALTAVGTEREWFEYRGIRAAICAPIALDGRVLGVLFFDYLTAKAPPMDIALAKAIADRCAMFLEHLSTEPAMDDE